MLTLYDIRKPLSSSASWSDDILSLQETFPWLLCSLNNNVDDNIFEHVGYLDTRITYKISEHIIEWLDKNSIEWKNINNYANIQFKNKNDAYYFKLVWG
jgi:hypothetical protein